jgi:hypothetical protein
MQILIDYFQLPERNNFNFLLQEKYKWVEYTEKWNDMRWMNKRMEWSWFRVLTKVEQINDKLILKHL